MLLRTLNLTVLALSLGSFWACKTVDKSGDSSVSSNAKYDPYNFTCPNETGVRCTLSINNICKRQVSISSTSPNCFYFFYENATPSTSAYVFSESSNCRGAEIFANSPRIPNPNCKIEYTHAHQYGNGVNNIANGWVAIPFFGKSELCFETAGNVSSTEFIWPQGTSNTAKSNSSADITSNTNTLRLKFEDALVGSHLRVNFTNNISKEYTFYAKPCLQ